MAKPVGSRPGVNPARSKAIMQSMQRSQSSIQVLADEFGITVEDKFKIGGSSGFVNVHIEKPDGRVISHKLKASRNFRQMTVYNKSEVDAEERREIVARLDKDGLSQTAIANQLGVTQPTISMDLKRIRAAKSRR